MEAGNFRRGFGGTSQTGENVLDAFSMETAVP